MSGHMKKRPTEKKDKYVFLKYAGHNYRIPVHVIERYRVPEDAMTPEMVFAKVNDQYTKPGALLRGLRVREGLTQVEMAEKLEVTQSDISQMENGTRRIGRTVAQRIEELFDVAYRSFLD